MTITPDFQQAAQQLCDYGRLLYQRDWSPATSSNYSVRLANDRCAITSSGKHKGQLHPDDILIVNFSGEALSPGKPSAETLLHTQLYLRDPHIGAVLHTHSPVSVVLSQIWRTNRLRIQGWELQKAFAGEDTHERLLSFPIFDNTQEIAALAQAVESDMQQYGQPHAYLIRGHGVYTWGQDLEECFRHLEALEHLLSYQLELLKVTRNELIKNL